MAAGQGPRSVPRALGTPTGVDATGGYRIMGNLRCKWVRDRLPLLAGDELVGCDRRKVERHLIGCPECRQHHDRAGRRPGRPARRRGPSPRRPDAPSLWPALARQIRESRRPAPAPVLAFAWPRGGWWSPVVGLGGLGLLAAIGVAVVLIRPDAARAGRGGRPVPPGPGAGHRSDRHGRATGASARPPGREPGSRPEP